MKRKVTLADLRPQPYVPPPTEFEKELIDTLPYSEIPHELHARAVVDFFLERGWQPPKEEA